MSAYQEFEQILFDFGVKATEVGGQEGMDRVEYGHVFHFEDKDAIRALKQNASKLSRSSLERLKGNLDETIIAGVREGKPIAEIQQEVAGIFENMRGYETERIARTEVARGVNDGALLGYGEMDVLVAEFYANAGACPICAAHHGELMAIGDARGFIPVHPNCYCFWLPRPDIKTRNIGGWRSVGEIPGDIVAGLGLERAFLRTAMSAETQTKILGKGAYHPNAPEKARLAIETADAGIIDEKGALCLITGHPDGGWNYIPIKWTDDYGHIVKTAYRIGPSREKQLLRKLQHARERHGI